VIAKQKGTAKEFEQIQYHLMLKLGRDAEGGGWITL